MFCCLSIDSVQSAWNRLCVDMLLLAVALVRGSGYLVAKDLSNTASVPSLLGWRFLLAAAAMGILWMWRVRRITGRAEAWTGLLLGLTQAAVLFLETFGVAPTQASSAGLIISLTVIFTPLLAAAAARRWLPPQYFVAAMVDMAGVALLTTGGAFATPNLAIFSSWPQPWPAQPM